MESPEGEANEQKESDVSQVNPSVEQISKVTKSKKTPLESPDYIRTRSYVVASFWAIVIFIGLPVWWWTTSIYRSSLPLEEMLQWADGKVCGLISIIAVPS